MGAVLALLGDSLSYLQPGRMSSDSCSLAENQVPVFLLRDPEVPGLPELPGLSLD